MWDFVAEFEGVWWKAQSLRRIDSSNVTSNLKLIDRMEGFGGSKKKLINSTTIPQHQIECIRVYFIVNGSCPKTALSFLFCPCRQEKWIHSDRLLFLERTPNKSRNLWVSISVWETRSLLTVTRLSIWRSHALRRISRQEFTAMRIRYVFSLHSSRNASMVWYILRKVS